MVLLGCYTDDNGGEKYYSSNIVSDTLPVGFCCKDVYFDKREGGPTCGGAVASG